MSGIIPTLPDNTPQVPRIEGDRLATIFHLQDCLNSRVSQSSEEFAKLTPQERAQWIINLKNAGDVEFKEVLDHMHWKWWKKNQTENLTEAQKEWIDRFHFVLSEGLVLGITPEILCAEYQRKNEINHQRQDSGTY